MNMEIHPCTCRCSFYISSNATCIKCEMNIEMNMIFWLSRRVFSGTWFCMVPLRLEARWGCWPHSSPDNDHSSKIIVPLTIVWNPQENIVIIYLQPPSHPGPCWLCNSFTPTSGIKYRILAVIHAPPIISAWSPCFGLTWVSNLV